MLQLVNSFNKFVIVSLLLIFATTGSYATVILDGFGNATTVTGVIVGAPRMMSVLVLALSTKSSGSPPPVPLPTFVGNFSGTQSAIDAIRARLNLAAVALVADGAGASSMFIAVVYDYDDVSTSFSSFSSVSTGVPPLPWGPSQNNEFVSVVSNAAFTAANVEVPEPGMLVLFDFGLAGIGFARRRAVR